MGKFVMWTFGERLFHVETKTKVKTCVSNKIDVFEELKMGKVTEA